MIRALPRPLTVQWHLLLPALTPIPWIILVWFAQHIANVGLPGDATIFYNAHGEHLYLGVIGDVTYAYSPAFAQFLQPFQQFSFGTFRALIAGVELFSLAYLIGPWWALGIVVFQVWPIWEEVLLGGNLQLFATAMLVLALRHPAAWPAVLLLKITPGIGILWPTLRGQWRNVAIGLGLTALIAGVSFAYEPRHWFEWVTWLTSQVDASGDRAAMPLWFRGILAVGIMVWAARTDRIWWVPVAAALASPEGHGHWIMLLGAVSLWMKARPRSEPSYVDRHVRLFED